MAASIRMLSSLTGAAWRAASCGRRRSTPSQPPALAGATGAASAVGDATAAGIAAGSGSASGARPVTAWYSAAQSGPSAVGNRVPARAQRLPRQRARCGSGRRLPSSCPRSPASGSLPAKCGMAGNWSGSAPLASSLSWSATKPLACSAASMAMPVTGALPVRSASNRFSVRWQAETMAGRLRKPAPPLIVWNERNTAFSVSMSSGWRSSASRCSSTLVASSSASTTNSLSMSSIRIPGCRASRRRRLAPAPRWAPTVLASIRPAAPVRRGPRPAARAARCRAAAAPVRVRRCG